jgi:transcriptional regulator with PAS, ATPase and Fis domain
MNIAPVLSPKKKKAGKKMEKHADPPHASLSNPSHPDGLIGESAPMQTLYELIEKVSQSTSPVLILGETGTGKELVALAIYSTGSRRHRVFVPVDCSALTPSLIESELFGHVKGAFTGADYSKRGLLQAADHGTIFLDEIGELSLFLQTKLLRALQEKEIRPVGSTERLPIDVRVIAATNRNLEAGVLTGAFRQDLYFRLNVIQIKLSALRERRVDIPLLVAYFLKKFSNPLEPVRKISDEAMRQLKVYNWPGNIRELENSIECAVALSSDAVLQVGDLPANLRHAEVSPLANNNEPLRINQIERIAIFRALDETGDDKQEAARLLGIGKTTLYRKLKGYARTLKSA